MVSQEYFDAIVQENIDEFGMDESEAYIDAQLQVKNLDENSLEFLFTTSESKGRSESILAKIEQINNYISALKAKGTAVECLDTKIIDSLAQDCTNKAEMFFATQHGLIGALIYLLTTPNALAKTKSSWGLLGKLMCCDKCKDAVPKEGIKKLLQESNDILESNKLKALLKISKGNERNKQIFFDNGIVPLLKKVLDSDDIVLVVQGCALLSELVTDNDRRPGIHPNTFIRGRKLAEHRSTSFLVPLLKFIAKVTSTAKPDELAKLYACVRKLLINDKACTVALENNIIEYSLNGLSMDDDLKSEVIECLAALGKNDNAKLAIAGQFSTILPALTLLLEERLGDPKLTLPLMKLFGTVNLRQPDVCVRLFEHKVLDNSLALMTYEAENSKILKEVMSFLRNMISSHENKNLIEVILDQNVESKIRLAHTNFPNECGDSAYSLLRELGLQYC